MQFNGFKPERIDVSPRDIAMMCLLVSTNLFGTKKLRKEDIEESLLRAPRHMLHEC